MSDTFNLVGVDPGTNYTGVVAMEVSATTLEIVSIKPHLIDVHGLESTRHKDLQFRLFLILNSFRDILRYYSPMIVTLEYGFINRLRPAAYGPLSQVRAVLEQSVMLLNTFERNVGFMRVNGFAPSTIKNAVGSKGGADKVTIEAAVGNIPEIAKHVDVNTLSEHEVDGIAIAYTQLKILRSNPHLLLI